MDAASFDNIGDVLRSQARDQPGSEFFRAGMRWITYGEMDQLSDRLAVGLARQGVRTGSVVALIVPNREEFAACFFACAKLGAILVPLNTFLKGEFLRYQLDDSHATSLIADQAGVDAVTPFLAALPNLALVIELDQPRRQAGVRSLTFDELSASNDLVPSVSPRRGDLLAILYTSGTTGLPKGCMLPHGYYLSVAEAMIDAEFTGPRHRVLSTFQLFHSAGQAVVLASTLLAGASVQFVTEFSARAFLDEAREMKATVLWGVGAVAAALLAVTSKPDDRDHDLTHCIFSPLSEDMQLEFGRRFGIPVSTEIYAQTECIPITIGPLSRRRISRSVGEPSKHLDVDIFDESDEPLPPGEVGEIVIRPRRAHSMFQGYWGRPDDTVATWRGLWHHTGDYGYIDAEGRMTFLDRKSDSIRRRGENISSLELEAALELHPDIERAAVVAVASELTEDDIRCFLTLTTGSRLTAEGFFQFFRSRLPYYAIPRYVDIVDEIPVNAQARVMKSELRRLPLSGLGWDLQKAGLQVAREQRRST